MATHDLRDLYELYRQIYAGPGNPLESVQSAPYGASAYTQQRDIPNASGDYAPGGEVSDGFLSLPTGAPQRGQYSTRLAGPHVGLRFPAPVGPFRSGRPAIPFGPGTIPDIPKPYVPELPIPQSVRDGLLAGALLVPWTLSRRTQGDSRPDGSTNEHGDLRSPGPSIEQPPNGGGGQSIGLLGLLLEALRRQRSAPNEEERPPSVQPDPNFRELRRVDAAKKTPKVDSPSLVPDDAPPDPESNTDRIRGGFEAGGGGGGRSTGGDGGGERNDADCEQEWARARKFCTEGLVSGDVRRNPRLYRYFSPEDWTVGYCAKTRVGEACGGEPYERPLSPEERAERNNARIQEILRGGKRGGKRGGRK